MLYKSWYRWLWLESPSTGAPARQAGCASTPLHAARTVRNGGEAPVGTVDPPGSAPAPARDAGGSSEEVEHDLWAQERNNPPVVPMPEQLKNMFDGDMLGDLEQSEHVATPDSDQMILNQLLDKLTEYVEMRGSNGEQLFVPAMFAAHNRSAASIPDTWRRVQTLLNNMLDLSERQASGDLPEVWVTRDGNPWQGEMDTMSAWLATHRATCAYNYHNGSETERLLHEIIQCPKVLGAAKEAVNEVNDALAGPNHGNNFNP